MRNERRSTYVSWGRRPKESARSEYVGALRILAVVGVLAAGTFAGIAHYMKERVEVRQGTYLGYETRTETGNLGRRVEITDD